MSRYTKRQKLTNRILFGALMTLSGLVGIWASVKYLGWYGVLPVVLWGYILFNGVYNLINWEPQE